jgi:hypothetical protein
MQEEMIREIKAASPEYIVYVDNILSWFPPPHADYTLLENMTQYIKDRYKRVGIVVTGPAPGQPVYYWDAAALNAPLEAERHSSCIFVYKLQKPAGPTSLKNHSGKPQPNAEGGPTMKRARGMGKDNLLNYSSAHLFRKTSCGETAIVKGMIVRGISLANASSHSSDNHSFDKSSESQ